MAKLKVGDTVQVPFVVKEVNENDDLHFVGEPLEPIDPNYRGGFGIKTRQATVTEPAPADPARATRRKAKGEATGQQEAK
jgi:hypothetical protein